MLEIQKAIKSKDWVNLVSLAEKTIELTEKIDETEEYGKQLKLKTRRSSILFLLEKTKSINRVFRTLEWRETELTKLSNIFLLEVDSSSFRRVVESIKILGLADLHCLFFLQEIFGSEAAEEYKSKISARQQALITLSQLLSILSNEEGLITAVRLAEAVYKNNWPAKILEGSPRRLE